MPIAEATIATPESVSVPWLISSPRTKERAVARLNIFFSSSISTAKVESPFARLSFETIRVNMESNKLNFITEAETKKPDCAISTAIPILFINEDLPLEFIPYKSTPFISCPS